MAMEQASQCQALREACGERRAATLEDGGPIRAVSKAGWGERQPAAPMQATQVRGRGEGRGSRWLAAQADMDGARRGEAGGQHVVAGARSLGRRTVDGALGERAGAGEDGRGRRRGPWQRRPACKGTTVCAVDGGASSREGLRS